MSDEAVAETPTPAPPRGYSEYKGGDFTIESSTSTTEEMEENLRDSEPENKDAPSKTPEEEEREAVSRAASELGKKGAEAKKAKVAEEKAEEPDEKAKSEEKAAKPEPKAEEKPNPRKDPNARVRQVTQENAELKRRLAALEARVSSPPPQGDTPEPKFEDYGEERFLEFIDARQRWVTQNTLKEHETQATQRQKEAEQRHVHEQGAEQYKAYWDQRMPELDQMFQEAQAADPEGWAALKDAAVSKLRPSLYAIMKQEPVTQSHQIADEMAKSDNPPGVFRYLAEHEDELQEIQAMTDPLDISRAMGMIAGKVGAGIPTPAPFPAKPQASKARPPIRPVGGSSQKADALELSDDLDDDTWLSRKFALAKRGR